MTRSTRLFARLLDLYPENLRRDYGDEMALVFEDDLAAARREAGLPGVIAVWRRVLVEFFRFALPECLSRPAVRVPALTLTTFLAMAGGFTGSLGRPPIGASGFDVLHAALLLPLFSPPLIFVFSILSTRRGTERPGLSARITKG